MVRRFQNKGLKIESAMQALKSGQYIRREVWSDHIYLRNEIDTIVSVHVRDDGSETEDIAVYRPIISDFFAEDWEVRPQTRHLDVSSDELERILRGIDSYVLLLGEKAKNGFTSGETISLRDKRLDVLPVKILSVRFIVDVNGQTIQVLSIQKLPCEHTA